MQGVGFLCSDVTGDSTAFVGVSKSIDNVCDEKTKVWLKCSWLCGWDAQGLEVCSRKPLRPRPALRV